MNEKERRSVRAIRDGIVIDHLAADSVFDILNTLDIHDERLTIAKNFKSKKMGVKSFIKISNKELTKDELNKIALLAPNATISKIKNFEVVEKFKVELPNKIESIECMNPNCITRIQDINTKFLVINKSPLKLKCHYCERIFDV